MNWQFNDNQYRCKLKKYSIFIIILPAIYANLLYNDDDIMMSTLQKIVHQ